MIKIVTHNGKFHADDVFAVATLFLLLGEENCEVIRTRDAALIAQGDYVVDVGEVYEPEKNRFDHHQRSGAGTRSNNIPYASFGLVWKKFGETVAGSKEVADAVDGALVQAIDGPDNGMDINHSLIDGISPYTISSVIELYRPTWKEHESFDDRFLTAAAWAREIIEREILTRRDFAEAATIVRSVYETAADKRLIVFDEEHTFGTESVKEVLMRYPEPLYAVAHRPDVGKWEVIAIRKSFDSFENRKPLPSAWAGLSDEKLAAASGVPDASFCHRNSFMCVAYSKEGALKMAEIALGSS